MAKLEFKGLDEYVAQLQRLRDASKDCIGYAVFDGAAVVADAVKSAIQSLPVDERRYVKNGQMLNGITSEQKQGLIDGFGIAPMQDDNGYLNVKLGFTGYNSMQTKAHPNGQPNAMIARSVNSGSSFRTRNPFVDNAVRQAKAQAEEKMKDTLDKEIQKVMK